MGKICKNINLIVFLVFILLSSCVKKKVAKYGCKDMEATNFDPTAEFDNGACVYKSLIRDPSFEYGEWITYSGTGFSWNAGPSSVKDGFMPTNGKYYLMCVPYINKPNGTSTKQYLQENKHCKGFYFDYSYRGVAGSDSVLNAYFSIFYSRALIYTTLMEKSILESYSSQGSVPNIYVQKKDVFVEIPYSENYGELYISTTVSKGTFTFCIDNIREVRR